MVVHDLKMIGAEHGYHGFTIINIKKIKKIQYIKLDYTKCKTPFRTRSLLPAPRLEIAVHCYATETRSTSIFASFKDPV